MTSMAGKIGCTAKTQRRWCHQEASRRAGPANTASGIWAESAYRSAEIEAALAARGLTTHIHWRRSRRKPLTRRQEAANKARSKVRARVEHVFGNQHNSMGGKFIRTIGILRASARIGMQNLAYNMRRLVVLERCAMAAR